MLTLKFQLHRFTENLRRKFYSHLLFIVFNMTTSVYSLDEVPFHFEENVAVRHTSTLILLLSLYRSPNVFLINFNMFDRSRKSEQVHYLDEQVHIQ